MTELSPQAQAVLDAYIQGLATKRRNALAAALRALADQASSAKHWHINEILAIAAELEGSDG